MEFNQKKIFHGFVFFGIMTILYWIALNLSLERHYLNFHFGLESMIPVIPIFSIVYISVYALYFMPFLFANDEKILDHIIKSYYIVLAISMFIFIAIPVINPLYNQGGSSFFLFNFIKDIDKPYNNFPSLHISLSFLALFFLKRVFDAKTMIKMYLWFGFVAISVLVIKQHSIMDVLGGMFLGFWSYYAVFKIWPYYTEPKKDGIEAP